MTQASVKQVVLLGATGSIGVSTSDVILQHPDRFAAHTLVGHRNAAKMVELAEKLSPQWVVMTDPDAAASLAGKLPAGCRLESGMQAAEELAARPEVDLVMAAMVGAAGLPATLAAVKAGKHVALANKECLVTAGRIFMQEAARSGAVIMPVDSEHAAVHQALAGHAHADVRQVILTASGGPFRDRDPSSLADVTPEEAVAHPNWDMGAKISIDSATMMNKALELIEAKWLFDMAPEKLSAIIHPQSIVHAMVEYIDGSVLAQLAEPDMRMPIAYAMQGEGRIGSGIPWLDLARTGTLQFQAVDERRFPAMRLVRDVLAGQDSLAIVFNAANEVANQAFRDRQIGFTAIVETVEAVLSRVENVPVDSLEAVWSHDREARTMTLEVIRH